MRAYSRSLVRTPSTPANRRAVLGLAMRRSSSKSEMESADTPLLADSSRRSIPRSSRRRLSRCSRGMGGSYPAIRRAERETSGRPDNLFSAGPNAPRSRCGVIIPSPADAPRKLPPKMRGIYTHGPECSCWICGDEAPAERVEVGASA